MQDRYADDIGDFGKSTGEKFIDLVRELDKVDGIERYRISSIPDIVLKFRRLSDVFHRRRRKKNLWCEFRIYCNGIRRIYGPISTKYVFPVMRMLLKLMPTAIVKWAYQSNIRKKLTEKQVWYKQSVPCLLSYKQQTFYPLLFPHHVNNLSSAGRQIMKNSICKEVSLKQLTLQLFFYVYII